MTYSDKQTIEMLWPEKAERIEIGKILLNHNNYYLSVQDSLKAEDFYAVEFQKLFTASKECFFKEGKIDLAKVSDSSGVKLSIVLELADYSGLFQSLSWPLEKVLDYSRRRLLHEELYKIQQRIGSEENSHNLFNELANIATSGRREKGISYKGEDIAHISYKRQEKRQERKNPIEGHRTGFNEVDNHYGGLVEKRITLLSGPAGHGKTSLAVNWLHNICIEDGIPCLFVSLEMGINDIVDRFLMITSDMCSDQLHMGHLPQSAIEALTLIKNAPLHITDNYPRDIHDVCATIERHVHLHNIKIWFLDYIGEIVRDNTIKGREDRDERYARWVKMLRDVSTRLSLHGVILAQVNAEGALAESRKMAHISDGYLHFERDGNKHILESRKNRFGPIGYQYNIIYNKKTQKMKEYGINERG